MGSGCSPLSGQSKKKNLRGGTKTTEEIELEMRKLGFTLFTALGISLFSLWLLPTCLYTCQCVPLRLMSGYIIDKKENVHGHLVSECCAVILCEAVVLQNRTEQNRIE